MMHDDTYLMKAMVSGIRNLNSNYSFVRKKSARRPYSPTVRVSAR